MVERANYTTPDGLRRLAGAARAAAAGARHLPPWVMADQEGGEANALPGLPPRHAPADLPSARAGAAEAAQAAGTLRGLGVTGVLGPSADVAADPEPALGARVYSDDPQEVAAFAAATARAWRRGRVLSAVGHFPGLGAADQDPREGPATVGLTLPELRRRDLVPFRAAFAAGAPAVLLSPALYPADDFTTPGSLSRRLVTGVLRGELHFGGVAIADDLADPAVTEAAPIPEAAVEAIRAGADMVYVGGGASDQQDAYAAVLRAVERGRLPRRRVDEALARVLAAKRRFGLLR